MICQPTRLCLFLIILNKLLVLRTTRNTRFMTVLSIFRPIKTHLELERFFSHTLLGYSWEKKVSHKTNQKKKTQKKKNTREREYCVKSHHTNASQHKPVIHENLPVFKQNQLPFFFTQQIQEQSTLFELLSLHLYWLSKKLFWLSRNINSSFVQFPRFCKIFVVVVWMSTHVLDVNALSKYFNWEEWVKSQTWFSKPQQPLFSKWWNESAKNTTHDTENHFRWQSQIRGNLRLNCITEGWSQMMVLAVLIYFHSGTVLNIDEFRVLLQT